MMAHSPLAITEMSAVDEVGTRHARFSGYDPEAATLRNSVRAACALSSEGR
jgi:hypothetical protein